MNKWFFIQRALRARNRYEPEFWDLEPALRKIAQRYFEETSQYVAERFRTRAINVAIKKARAFHAKKLISKVADTAAHALKVLI